MTIHKTSKTKQTAYPTKLKQVLNRLIYHTEMFLLVLHMNSLFSQSSKQ